MTTENIEAKVLGSIKTIDSTLHDVDEYFLDPYGKLPEIVVSVLDLRTGEIKFY